MCLIGVPNLKEIDSWEGCFWLAQSYFCKMSCEEEEEEIGEENRAIFRNTYLANYWTDFFQIWYVGSRIWRA